MTMTLDEKPHIASELISEFPNAPQSPHLVTIDSGPDAWLEWCRARGFTACAVTPVTAGSQLMGSIGLASAGRAPVRAEDLQRLALLADLAAETRQFEQWATSLERQFDEATRALLVTPPVGHGVLSPQTAINLADRLGRSVDVTYCRLGVCKVASDGGGTVAIRASGGIRPPDVPLTTQRLADLPGCVETLFGRPVVLNFEDPNDASRPERQLLFSPTTRTGVLVPFVISSRETGLLILGEERGSRSVAFTDERLEMLQAVASRVGEGLRLERATRRGLQLARKRQTDRAARAERRRLARELHDEVGQALSGLLVWLRFAKSVGYASRDDLEGFESATQNALNAARSVARGLREAKESDPLEDARQYAEQILSAVGCKLAWVDARSHKWLETRAARAIGHIIKEAITNTMRHANARLAEVHLETDNGSTRVTIRDDGAGFLPERMRSSNIGGLGLRGMQERAAQIRASVEVDTSPGTGTTIVLELPRPERLAPARVG